MDEWSAIRTKPWEESSRRAGVQSDLCTSGASPGPSCGTRAGFGELDASMRCIVWVIANQIFVSGAYCRNARRSGPKGGANREL